MLTVGWSYGWSQWLIHGKQTIHQCYHHPRHQPATLDLRSQTGNNKRGVEHVVAIVKGIWGGIALKGAWY